jgi:hypothetical protein
MPGLTPEQVSHFRDEGYLVVKGLFDPVEDLEPVAVEYYGVLDRLTDSLFERGEISSRYEDLPFSDRLIKIQQETGKNFIQHFDFSLPQSNITSDTPIWLGKAIFNVLRNRHLLDAVESLIGPEIFANPVQHVRLKMPESAIPQSMSGNVRTTPWHQDNAVVTPDADETQMVTVWFPLWDAPLTSGPLKIVPRSHIAGLRPHCPSPAGMQIPEKVIAQEQVLPVPLDRGDAIFMHRLTCHASLPNYGKNIRWSLDLRYHPVGQATGRSVFPGFVARSRSAPETELREHKTWADQWLEARARLAIDTPKAFHRWDANAEICA